MAKAAVTHSIRDDHQKNFLKSFNSLTGKHFGVQRPAGKGTALLGLFGC